MTNFDPALFMEQQMDQPLETEFRLCPEGEFIAIIDDFTADAIEVVDFEYKKGPRAGTPGSMTKLTLPYVIQDAGVQQSVGRDKVVVFQQMILDIGADGGLDFGPNKNIALGRARAAVGQNVPGPWTIAQLKNAGPLMVKVVHRKYDRKDGTKGENAEVERVAPIRGSASAAA